jgi:hypothetical protein
MTMALSSPKRLAWFERGVQAFRAVATPDAPAFFMCPLCHRGALRDSLDREPAVWTFEHAPPESLGGREVCLICRPCNSRAGETVDAHMKRRENVFDFTRGTMSEARPALLEIGDVAFYVDCHNGLLTGIQKANRPGASEMAQAAMEELVRTRERDCEFKITLYRDAFHERMAEVGWLKSAYMVAFAVFGYRYVPAAGAEGTLYRAVQRCPPHCGRRRATLHDRGQTGAVP